jgi:hypothetical protein
MNDLFHIITSGGSVTIPYAQNYGANYTRYRVEEVMFHGKFLNNDTTANTGGYLIVYPNDVSGALPVNAAQWAQARDGKYTKSSEFSLTTANKCSFSLRARFRLSKIYGRDYLENETYAAIIPGGSTVVGASPTTVLSMVLAVSAAANFTVTVGGLFAEVRIKKTVRFWGPDANDSLLVVSDGSNFLGFEQPDPLAAVISTHVIASQYLVPKANEVLKSDTRYHALSYSTRMYIIEDAAHRLATSSLSLATCRDKIIAQLDPRLLHPDLIYIKGPFFSSEPDICINSSFSCSHLPVDYVPSSDERSVPPSLGSTSSPPILKSHKFCSSCGVLVSGCRC